jgi:hypothetical protein
MPFEEIDKKAAAQLAHGTVVTEKCQGHYLQWVKTFGVDTHNLSGVCFEWCRRYITYIVTGNWEVRKTVEMVMWGPGDKDNVNVKYVQMLIDMHVATRNFVDGNFNVNGLDRSGQLDRGVSCFQFTGLRSREDVLNHMYKNEGNYIYAVTGGTSGHAVAFSVTQNRIIFFDPNCGEVYVPESTKKVRAKFLAWWNGFWDRSGMKAEFHKGDRRLVRYTKNP